MAYPPPGGGYPSYPQAPGYPGYPPSGPTPYPPGPAAPQSGPWVPGVLPQGPPPPTGQFGMPAPYPSPYPAPGGYPSGPSPYPSGPSPPSTYPPPPSTYPLPPSTYPPPPSTYPPPPSQPPLGTTSYPPSSTYPFPQQQAPGGYMTAPPPVPTSYTHPSHTHPSYTQPSHTHPSHTHPSHTHPSHSHSSYSHYPTSDPVGHATERMAAMSVSKKTTHEPPKQPPTEGTVTPHRPFDPEADAKTLRVAMKGFGTDEKAIINVLAYRSNDQRQVIKQKFKTLYGKDLIRELKSELSSHFEHTVLGLMMTSAEYDAHELREAVKGLGTAEDVLIEILCTRTNEEIEDIKRQYKSDFGRDLERDIRSDTSGHFKRLLISMLTGARDYDTAVDRQKARADAQALYNAGEAKWGTDESMFNQILASRSFAHLRVVFQEYSKICKYDIEQSISREMSGDLEKGMLTVVKVVRNKSGYFAERLYKSMKGLGTDDDTLVRVMVTRCEVDMVQIKKIFRERYHESLGSFIKGDTSGDYKRILMALARED